VRSADEIAYEITAVYYDDDKVADMVRRAREEMKQACINTAELWLANEIADKLRAIPNR